ncbi:N-acetylglucosaminidase [Staphylococcus petrasii]|uniref:N-acetylglucosaminidase n=1 Tax=Staphylococcus petrasii TaxID=1276936 RepID=UPI000CD23F03|nr:N-acetylglucosaminidase [Staphylococcus petrasii]PNZ82175.1 autolysin [Staphylococcus petrasii]TGA81839.1 autolysin [Staphylococcus petrasii]SUM59342.1 Autolysin E [Staphylococcus petrasii]
MKKYNHLKFPMILLVLVLIALVVLLIFNKTNILRSDLNYHFQEAVRKQTQSDLVNTVDKNGDFTPASNTEVEQAMQIKKNDNNLKYMDLYHTVPMSKEEVTHILKGKGILEDQANAFIEAQDKYGVNILYLISHARVETNNGKSELAQGIKDGNHQYYNFFGIGAFDEDAIHTGKSYAKEQQWTSPRKAILGGAKFIQTTYFENEQRTLYQMRWNPQNPGQHQYASDIEWPDKIATYMKEYYDHFGIKKDKIRRNYYISKD